MNIDKLLRVLVHQLQGRVTRVPETFGRYKTYRCGTSMSITILKEVIKRKGSRTGCPIHSLSQAGYSRQPDPEGGSTR